MPDIDVDFEDERRDEVIDYVSRKYGQDHVAQIITNKMLNEAGIAQTQVAETGLRPRRWGSGSRTARPC